MSTVLNYIWLVGQWCFFFSLVYLPLRLLLLKGKSTLSRELALWFFHLSLIAVLSQTLTTDGTVTGMTYSFRFIFEQEYISLVPFKIFSRVAEISDPVYRLVFGLVNVAGNVIIFVPAGFCAMWAFRMKVWQATLAGAGLSLFVELGQRLLPRTTDVDDLIMNTAGAFIGALLWYIPAKIIEKKAQKRQGNG